MSTHFVFAIIFIIVGSSERFAVLFSLLMFLMMFLMFVVLIFLDVGSLLRLVVSVYVNVVVLVLFGRVLDVLCHLGRMLFIQVGKFLLVLPFRHGLLCTFNIQLFLTMLLLVPVLLVVGVLGQFAEIKALVVVGGE